MHIYKHLQMGFTQFKIHVHSFSVVISTTIQTQPIVRDDPRGDTKRVSGPIKRTQNL